MSKSKIRWVTLLKSTKCKVMTQLQTLTPYKATLFTASFSSKKMFS